MKRPRRWIGKLGLGFWSFVVCLVLVAAYLALVSQQRPNYGGDALRFNSFVKLVERDRILDAKFLNYDSYIIGRYKRDDGTTASYKTTYLKNFDRGGLASQNPLLDLLVANDVPTTIDQQFNKSLIGPLSLVLPALLFVLLVIYLVLSYRRGSGLFGIRSGARRFSPDDQHVTFGDVAGQDAAVTELREVSQFIAAPERFAAVGAQVPRGVLLYGPPGCGKTLMAKALAGEIGASFYSISGSDFVELYVGVGASRVRDLFKVARENAPAIIFIDELDAIGRRRTVAGTASSGGEQDQALNQILTEMDGFSPREQVVVVGATNRPDVLDPALLRPGRFDRAIALERPDERSRLAILEVHTRGKPLAPDVDLAAVAHDAVGMTGADLASVVNEAGLLAGRDGEVVISQARLQEALRRVRETPERQRRLSARDRSIGQRSLAEERVTFDDVAGADEAIEELAEVSEFLAEPERFLAIGAHIPRGYLLIGPPGTGKTLLARAVAGEASASFFSVSASEFAEVFVGEGAARVRDLFAAARAAAPAIIFIDELDSVGARRGSYRADGEQHQTLNQILTEMDGFNQRAGVVVMAATNRVDVLDPALVRPGRFDRTVTLDLPDREARADILRIHARGKPLAANVDLDAIARLGRGMSGADLANVINEAALLTARRGETEITRAMVELAIDRVTLGLGRAAIPSEEERRTVAYHEAGHGLLALALPGGRVLHKLTIIPRGRALGVAWTTEDEDGLIQSRSAMIENMAGMLGGRAAEEIVFGEPSSGASSDLLRVGALARHMVCELGMSETAGPLNYAENGHGDNRAAVHSDTTATMIDAEVRALVDEAHDLARQVLSGWRDGLDRVAAALLEHETLTLAEVEEVAGPVPSGLSRA